MYVYNIYMYQAMCYHVMCLGCVFKTFDVVIVRGEVIRKNFINKFKLMSVL